MTMKRLLSILFLLPLTSWGAIYHVTANGAGNRDGTTWANAMQWSGFNPTGGNTYYLAGMSYSGRAFTTGGSSGNWVVLRKATGADHGSNDAGWSATWGTTVATISGIDLYAGYWEIDGVTGGGPSAWKTGHGIYLDASDPYSCGVRVWGQAGVTDHYNFKHLKVIGDGGDGNGPGNEGFEFRENGAYTDNPHDILISYCYIELMGDNSIKGGGNNVTIEYTYFGWNESSSNEHGEHILWFIGTAQACGDFDRRPLNMTLRWCYFDYNSGTGVSVTGVDGLYIYGNVFHWNEATWGSNTETANGIICTVGRLFLRNTYVYNNSFVTWGPRSISGEFGQCSVGNNNFANNIVYRTAGLTGGYYNSHQYNSYFSCANEPDSLGTGEIAYSTGGNAYDPFTSRTSLDFSLKTNIIGTTSIDALYRTDMYGTVGSSRGAIQFGSGTGSAPNITSNNASGTVGALFGYQIAADQSPTSYGASNLPDGLTNSPSTGFISGYPTRVQTNVVILAATNSFGWDTQAVTMTITAPAAQITTIPTVLDFWFWPTNSSHDLTITVTNSGAIGSTLTGYVDSATSPFSLPATTTFNLTNTQTATITVRYAPGATVGSSSNTVTFRDGTGAALTVVPTIGRAYPWTGNTNWFMTNSLLLRSMASDGPGPSIYQVGDTQSQFDNSSIAVFGFYLGSNTSARLWARYIATNLSGDSYRVNVNALPYDPTTIWDMRPWRTNYTDFGYVHWRGSGTVGDETQFLMQYPSNSFTWTNGINAVVVYGREPAYLKELTVDLGASSPSGETNAPLVNITSPTNAWSVYPIAYTPLTNVTGTASDASGVASVNWTNDSHAVGGVATGTTSWSVPSIALTSGTNLIKVTSVDSSANANKSTNTLTVIYTPDTTAPTIHITSHAATGVLTSTVTPIALYGTNNDANGTASMTWTNSADGVGGKFTNNVYSSFGSLAHPYWSISSLALTAGVTNTFTLTATDTAASPNTGTTNWQVYYATNTSPASATGLSVGTVRIGQ